MVMVVRWLVGQGVDGWWVRYGRGVGGVGQQSGTRRKTIDGDGEVAGEKGAKQGDGAPRDRRA